MTDRRAHNVAINPTPPAPVNADCPARWVIACISCETPVEPWQTAGYPYGYCPECFVVLMDGDEE